FEAFGQTMLGIEVAGEQEQQKPDWRALSVWRAEVRTDATGAGKVELVLPPKPGRWQIRLRGISKDSLVGEASTSVVTADELLLQAVLPASLTEGDAPGGRLVVHNTGDDEKQLSVRVSIDGKPGPGIERKVEGGRRHEAELEFPTREVGVHELVCAASSKGGDKAKEMQSIEVLPWGLEERVARSGLGSGAYELRLALPEGREYRSRSLVIDLGPELIEELLPAAGIRRRTQLNLNSSLCECEIPTHANRAARGLAALAFYRHRASGRPGEKGVLARLRASIEASVAELESLEKGGEVSWIGRSKGDVRASLLSWLFLERARQAGFAVDEKVLARFRGKLPAWLRSRNLDLAALAFLVSAEARRSDFTRFNSLYRARRAMGLGGLGMLCLAAHAMERPELAEGIRPELAKKLEALLGRGSGAPDVKLRPAPVDLEGALWGFLALSRARGYGALLERAESWIHARRRPWGWSNGMVTALAIDFFGGRKRSRLAARVTVKVNGRFEKSVDFRADPSHRRIVVPLENLADGENRITIATSGRGRVVWSALLTGLT
ncbi:MAG: alpha-2-macroglobulin family protein, partial [Planctomycetota bacterium]